MILGVRLLDTFFYTYNCKVKKYFNIAVYAQDTYNDYPDSASNNAKRALAIRDEGGKTSNCGTRVGWTRANQLAKKESISRETVARMASFARHRQNSEGDPRENCGPLMWLAWGGTSGVNWAINKMEQIRKNADTVNFFGEVDDVMALQRMEEIIEIQDGNDLEFLINSPGGDVFAGMTIASLIARRNGTTTTTAVGVAASIASIILLAGDKVQMDNRAFLMIHDAWSFSAGDATDLRKDAKLLDKISNQLAELYTKKIAANNKLINGDYDETKKEVRRMMRAETWLNADEAYKMGLIDEIVNGRTEMEEIELPMGGEHETDKEEEEMMKTGFFNRLKSFKNTPIQVLDSYKNCNCHMEDKKTFLQKLANFFGLSATIDEIEEQPKEAPQPEQPNEEQMTIEEMKAALAANGYEIEKKPQPVEEVKEESTPVELSATEALLARIEKLENDLKEEKFKNAATTTAKKTAPAASAKAKVENKYQLSNDQLSVFDELAALASAHAKRQH